MEIEAKGEREFTSKLNPSKGGENASNMGREELHTPDAWCSRGEHSHVFRGERHVHFVFYVSFALIFYSLSSPNIHYKIQGEKDI